MADISIIIVNYNVRHFLLKCLESIEKSASNINYEVIIVDNASIDGSILAVKEKFPSTKIIENKNNVGFSKANNQGIKIASGRYILILNPDTILQEDTLIKCMNYMQSHPECGLLGVKMVDGGGKFLPESKRGLPGLWNSFCKFSGISALFPKSKLFNGYYLGHLSTDEVNEVDVLCGAFMFFRKEVLLECKGFDEDYFMYGEDIELSKSVTNRGYKVIYFPDTRIIHFKGESSKKASFNYVLNFYKAMSIYVGKNYHGFNGSLLKWLIKAAIIITGVLSFIKNNLIGSYRLIFDGVFVFISMEVLKKFWAKYYFNDASYLDNKISLFNNVAAVIIWIITIWFFGHYDKNWKIKRQIAGIFAGSIIILTIYALLPVQLRSSRAMILIGVICTFLITNLTNKLFNFIEDKMQGKGKNKKYIIVAESHNAVTISNLIYQTENNAEILGVVAPFMNDKTLDASYINSIENLHEVIRTMRADNVVFSNKDLSLQSILDFMTFSEKDVKYLITGSDVDTVISSQSSKSRGYFYHADSGFKLSKGLYQRLKRLTDLSFCFVFAIFSPLLLFFINYRKKVLNNLFLVFIGHKTWVGYNENEATGKNLPIINDPVFEITDLICEHQPLIHVYDELCTYYAKQYSIWMDIKIILHNLFDR